KTPDGDWRYEWDYHSNLRRVVTPRHVVEMDYDGRGRRIRKRVFESEVMTVKRSYIWSNQTVLHEVNELTGETRTYLRHNNDWAPFGHIDADQSDERPCYYVSDPSGMPDVALSPDG